MGAEPYFYFVPYQRDADAALQELRRREFEAGRYNPVMSMLYDQFPLRADAPSPGRQHGSIDEAREEAAADGTRSILDLERVGDDPDYFVAARLPEAILHDLYGTPRPTRAMVEGNLDFLEEVERGHGVYFVIYEGDRPSELFFGGYSFD